MMDFWAVLMILAAGIVPALFFGPLLIPALKRLKFGQTERENGVKSHLKKQGTPTIGGLIFLIPLIIVVGVISVVYHDFGVLFLLIPTVGFGLIGFLDDFLKIKKKSKDGLLWFQKMFLLILVSAGFGFALYYLAPQFSTAISFDFFKWRTDYIDLGIYIIPYIVLVLISSTNAVNLTDGLDGLCTGSTIIVLLMFVSLSLTYDLNVSVTRFATVLIGTLISFLIFNYNPAKIFMGDTGSLALGGALGAITIILGKPLFLVIGGLLFVIEALSVLLQVSWFKLTRGKRLFKMAPIHHHFELCGWSEKTVVFVFWIFTLGCCILTYLSYAFC